ncbi:hypothetical protein RN001_002146 [Aquatica leii]|uniref:Uncharacterized protein n=1 Tax=Aquatica leii TaxID=1421715 RepID=A0AAN7QAX9_9COLE|nr:hypothetical protein RN001_002146 [Aquatica leii]
MSVLCLPRRQYHVCVEDSVENMDLSLSAPNNEFLDHGEHSIVANDDGHYNIKNNTAFIHEAEIPPITIVQDPQFTEEEIMDMSTVISTKKGETDLNDNTQETQEHNSYLLWMLN